MSYKYLHDGKEHFINGVGTELAWGWSPAIDFTEILERREKHATDDTEYVAEETKEEPEEGKTTNGDNVKKDRKFDLDIDAMIAAIQQRIPKEKKDEGSRDVVRVLLCGACDIRHIFRTLSSLQVKSKMAAQPPPVYHFFI
ncbi:putative dynein assembly factor 3, axonemal, partial [Trypanosoma cruzi]